MVSNLMGAKIAMSLFGKLLPMACSEIWVRRPEQGLATCIVLMSIQTLIQVDQGPQFEKLRYWCYLRLYQERAGKEAVCA